MSIISCGIDFGTSNSSVAIADGGKFSLAPLEDSHVTMPSAIFFRPGMPPLFGRQAVQYFFERHDGRFMRSLKRVLGTSLMKQGTIVNGKPVKFEVIIASFLTALRQRTIGFAGKEIENVVMGRPVHFVDNSADADARAEAELREIARTVGFKNIEFQFEPIAAAFAHEINVNGEQLAIVADLGGGTSDFTVIRLSKDRMSKPDRSTDILGSTGVRVGGNDFDKELCMAMIMPELGYRSTYGRKNLEVPLKYYHDLSEWSKVNFLYTAKVLSQVRQFYNESHDPVRFGRLLKVLENENGHAILSIAEDSKISLTAQHEAQATLDFIEPGLALEFSRIHFEESIVNEIRRISLAAQECIHLAGVKASDIQLAILTGGSTEIPMVQSLFRALFPTAIIADENKLSSVGLGLAYDSERRFR